MYSLRHWSFVQYERPVLGDQPKLQLVINKEIGKIWWISAKIQQVQIISDG